VSLSVLKSVFAGVGGCLVLIFFFSTFLSVGKILFFIPAILGFNGLVLGYGLVDKLRANISSYPLFAFVMGAGEGAAVFVAVKLMDFFLGSGFMLTGYDLLVYIFVSGITSVLGAYLAVRYFNL
jgi:hypothetical protein